MVYTYLWLRYPCNLWDASRKPVYGHMTCRKPGYHPEKKDIPIFPRRGHVGSIFLRPSSSAMPRWTLSEGSPRMQGGLMAADSGLAIVCFRRLLLMAFPTKGLCEEWDGIQSVRERVRDGKSLVRTRRLTTPPSPNVWTTWTP